MSGKRLDGKVAIITGAGSGIGEASAMRFAAEGAAVLCADRNAEGAENVATSIREADGRALAFVVDVTDPAGTEGMAQAAIAEWGTIDILYANAGVTGEGSVTETDLDDWDRVLAINLTGPFLCARAVVPAMRAAKRGSIILQASGAALVGLAHIAAYSAAKGGVVALGRQLAADYGPDNIRANVIAPGTMWTPLVQSSYEGRVAAGNYASVEEGRAHSLGMYPLGRLGEPEECANLALFLASDESAWITGTVCPVDGGMTSTRSLIPYRQR